MTAAKLQVAVAAIMAQVQQDTQSSVPLHCTEEAAKQIADQGILIMRRFMCMMQDVLQTCKSKEISPDTVLSTLHLLLPPKRSDAVYKKGICVKEAEAAYDTQKAFLEGNLRARMQMLPPTATSRLTETNAVFTQHKSQLLQG